MEELMETHNIFPEGGEAYPDKDDVGIEEKVLVSNWHQIEGAVVPPLPISPIV